MRWRIIASILVLASALTAAAWAVSTYAVEAKFSAQAWNDQAHIDRGERLWMARRLVRDNALIGLTREQVTQMLDGPNSKPTSGTVLEYELFTDFFHSDGVRLRVTFDPSGRVVEQQIVGLYKG